MKRSGNKSTIIHFNSNLLRTFGSDYVDNADNEQPDTTDMFDLESEKPAGQENQEGKGLKILTPSQMFSRFFFNSIRSRE